MLSRLREYAVKEEKNKSLLTAHETPAGFCFRLKTWLYVIKKRECDSIVPDSTDWLPFTKATPLADSVVPLLEVALLVKNTKAIFSKRGIHR